VFTQVRQYQLGSGGTGRHTAIRLTHNQRVRGSSPWRRTKAQVTDLGFILFKITPHFTHTFGIVPGQGRSALIVTVCNARRVAASLRVRWRRGLCSARPVLVRCRLTLRVGAGWPLRRVWWGRLAPKGEHVSDQRHIHPAGLGGDVGQVRSWSGREAVNCRLTRSPGRGEAGSTIVVRRPRPRLTPRSPAARISRSTVPRQVRGASHPAALGPTRSGRAPAALPVRLKAAADLTGREPSSIRESRQTGRPPVQSLRASSIPRIRSARHRAAWAGTLTRAPCAAAPLRPRGRAYGRRPTWNRIGHPGDGPGRQRRGGR
jgi:hypothetical protein